MIYEEDFKNYSSYDYNPKINFEDLENLNYPSISIDYKNDFEYSLRTGKIKILRSSYLGWFGGNNSKEDLDYTFKQYWKKISYLLKDENYRPVIEKRKGFFNDTNKRKRENDRDIYEKEQQKINQKKHEEEEKIKREKQRKEDEQIARVKKNLEKEKQEEKEEKEKQEKQEKQEKENLIRNENIADIKSRNFSFFKILKDYNIAQTDNYSLAALKHSNHWDEKQFMEFLVRNMKDYYNRKNLEFTDFVNRYNTLSFREKQEVKNLEKSLNGILKILKPLLFFYDPEVIRLNQELTEMEKTTPQKLKDYRIPVENLRKVNLRMNETHENIEKLKEKISDVKKKISTATSEKNKNIHSKKSDLRVLLLKYENELKKIEIRMKQLQVLKEKTGENLSEINREKIYRLSELDAFRSLNEKQIREKNALEKSLEFEKILTDIRNRELERIRQEELLKQEIEEAEKVYQQEKIINDKKIKEAKKRKNIAEDIEEWKREELENSRKEVKILKSDVKKKKAKLHQKDVEIEYKKKIVSEKIQQNFLNQNLQRDIQKLDIQKQILQKITNASNTYTENVKKEISLRQEEIEKTIKLNLENLKQREANLFSEESKIKLDVFYTLEDVKDQTAKKLDLEKKLQDLKDEIIRKQDVTNLLNDTVNQIENNEIEEIEEYNNFLQSEIDFKKKLAKENLTLAEYKELVAEEKEDLIERLEHVKSQKLKKIYQTRENAIEQQMKIILLEGSEDLKNNLFSTTYEIENLEKQLKISERKEDFAKFQSDNFKKELKLRNQEIELLKNIRLKVLQKERLDLRSQANQEIIDTVKKIEAKEKQDVVEKLDEIIDDVENVEINRKSKAALFSVLDKIEDAENKEIAKEKVNFILGKIELHDNIEDARKKLDAFFKDKQIKKEVSEKLDEILDDVELDENDYDYLDEDDGFDNFLSNVKKHISGEKKMEQFSRIDNILTEERKIDAKLKMDENIEMKKIGPGDYEQGEGSQETSFDEFSDYNFFIKNIEDETLREKTRTFLGNIDSFEKEEEKIPKIKNAYKSAINSALWEDQLDTNYWKGKIIKDERAKFDYEQKINNINKALAGDYDLHLDPTDARVKEFLDIKLINSFSEKRKEINGYIYEGEKIISRNKDRKFFYFEKIKKVEKTEKFIQELKNIINNTARSQITNATYFEGEKAVTDCAVEYIGELREEQSNQIDSAKNGKEMRDALRNANDMDEDIKKIKKNLPFKMRWNIFKRTLSWKITKLLRKIWKNKKVAGGLFASLILAGIGILLNQLGVVAVVHHLKNAARAVHQYANDVHEMGKRIILSMQSLYRIPGNFIGYTLFLIGFFLQGLYFLSYFSGGLFSGAIFESLGLVIEVSLYFDTNFENINNSTANVVQDAGNKIQKISKRGQEYLEKNAPPFVWGKLPEKKTMLQIVESGIIKALHGTAKGTEEMGKVIEETGDTMKKSYYYMKIFFYVVLTLIILIIFRDLSNLTIIKNGNETKKSASKRGKKT